MTALARPQQTIRLDPLVDAPLVGPRLLALVGDDSGCSMWRAWQPVRCLRLHGYPCDWVATRDPSLVAVPFDYQAVLFCRQAWGREHRRGAKGMLRRWKDAGLKLLFEADDDLFTPFVTEQQLGRVNPEKTRAELEADREAALWVLGKVDGVTVTTQYLASTVRRFTDAPVEVVPNALDAEWFLERQRDVPRPVRGLTIGWAGGNRPDSDVAAMAEGWGRIARRFPDVTFRVIGHQPPVLREFVPEARIHRTAWLPTHDYPRALVGLDIGCCPLEWSPFNRSKSAIKAYEYAVSGAAVVASPTVYGNVLRHGANGHLASTPGEWEHNLAYLLEHPDDRIRQARRLRREVLGLWSLRRNYWRWPLAWNRLAGG